MDYPSFSLSKAKALNQLLNYTTKYTQCSQRKVKLMKE